MPRALMMDSRKELIIYFIHSDISSNLGQLKYFGLEGENKGQESDHDPEELLAHPDDAADPSQQGQLADGEVRPRLLHLDQDHHHHYHHHHH